MGEYSSTAIAKLPPITLPVETQRRFFNLNFATRYKIFTKIAQLLEEDINYEDSRQEELEHCKTLVQLGASNAMILSTLSNKIEEHDIQQIRKELGISTSGRIKTLSKKENSEIYNTWKEIVRNNGGYLQDEYSCWLLLATYFPKRTLGELHKAVRNTETLLQSETM